MTVIMGHIDGHRLIDRKPEEGGTGRRFINIGRLDIPGSLHDGGDRFKGIGTVDIDLCPGLKAGGGHHIGLPTGNRQV